MRASTSASVEYDGSVTPVTAAPASMAKTHAQDDGTAPRRASNACNVCRRLKMRCVVPTTTSDTANGVVAHVPQPPCQRCARVGHVCSFDEALACRKTRRKRKASDEERLRVANERIAAMELELQRQRQGAQLEVDDGDSSSGVSGSSRRRSSVQRANTFSSTSSILTRSTGAHSSAKRRRAGGVAVAADSARTHEDEASYPLGLLAEASLHVTDRHRIDASAVTTKTHSVNGATAADCASRQPHMQHAGNALRLRRRRRGGNDRHPFWCGNEVSPESHEVITSGLVTWPEVEQLYAIFFDGPAQHFLTLDADLHTLARIASRSSVLLTAVIAIGARYYAVRPSLHVDLYRTATRLAAMCVVDGVKSVEIVQALLLLCMWPLPSSHWTEDRAWMLSGLALRMATELNLHEHSHAAPPSLLSSAHQQIDGDDVSTLDELRNRQRVYLTCFAVDRSFSTLQGRNVVLPESRLTMNIRQWTTVMPGCKPWDVGIGSFIDLMRTITQQLTYLHSRRSDVLDDDDDVVDRELLAQVNLFDDQIDQWKEFWSKHGLFDSVAAVTAEQCHRRGLDERLFISLVKQTPLRLGYAKLVINSFGLQHCLGVMARRASGKDDVVHDDSITTDVSVLFSRCWRAARQVVSCALEGLRPAFRYAPATQLLVVCYAAVSLLKLRRHPLLLASVSGVQDDAVQLVVQLAELLDTIALDDSHTPALYASFLWSLVQHAQQQHGGDEAQGQSGSTTVQPNDGLDATIGKAAAFDEQIVDALYADANFVRHHIAATLPPQQQQADVLLASTDAMLDGDGMASGGGNDDNGNAYVDDRGWLQDDLLLGDDFWSMIAPVGLTHSNGGGGAMMPLEWC